MFKILSDLSLEELSNWLKSIEIPAYRARQIFDWTYKKFELDPAKMLNLPLALREKLQIQFKRGLELKETQNSSDGQTCKFLFRLHDGQLIESVLIEAPGRYTLCVSSQVGCAARCSFCASGKQGLIRNLSTGEILEQFIEVANFLQKEGKSLTNLVYMGMGEPLHNYDAVVESIRRLTSPQGTHFSSRRITVSTVGVIEGIERLEKDDLGIHLVLSLHAPNHETRKKIIPTSRQYPLEVILAACDSYSKTTGRDMTFEYTMLEGYNSSTENARELADLLQNRQCTVNLIPYNPIPGMNFTRPSTESIEAFRAVLTDRGINHTCRYTKGVDIAAACGQLALRKKSKTTFSSFPLAQE